MNYEVVVVVSKLEIQLFYSQNRNAYQVFEYEGTPKVPFCVFSDGSTFEIGKPAKLKFDKNLGNCFYDYFNLIKDQKLTFPHIIDSKKPIKFILFQFIENLLKELLTHLLTGKSINDVRKDIKLNLLFANDIEDRHIDFVGNLFKENGYGNLSCVSYRYLFLNYLKEYKQSEAFSSTKRNVNDLKGFVNVDAIDDDLHLSFFDNIEDKSANFVNVGEGLAKDPKVEILAKKLFETTANSTGSLSTYEKEKAMLIPLAKKYVKENKREFRVAVTLSDGSTKRALIKMSRIDDMLFHYTSMSKDIDLVAAFVRKTKTEAIDLGIVVHNTVNSQNFIDHFKTTFTNIFVSDIDYIDVLDLFLNNPQFIERGDRINANKPTKRDSGDTKTSKSNAAGTSGSSVTTSTTVKRGTDSTRTNPVSNQKDKSVVPPINPVSNKKVKNIPPPPPPMGVVNKPKPTSPNKQAAPNKTAKKVPPPPPFIGSTKVKTGVPPTNPVANKKSKTGVPPTNPVSTNKSRTGIPPPNPVSTKKSKRPPPPPPPPPLGKK